MSTLYWVLWAVISVANLTLLVMAVRTFARAERLYDEAEALVVRSLGKGVRDA